MLTVLAGGVGAARFLRGLVRIVPPERITAIVNVGDDLTLHGLRICPDLDSITYTLAGIVHPVQQWGRADERFTVRDELSRLGRPPWFTLGDRDLGTHLYRTGRLADGASLSEVTHELSAARGVGPRLLPATDDLLETRVVTHDGRDLHFQEWWVGERARSDVQRVEFRGAAEALPGPDVIDAIMAADAVIVAPSNPVVSIGPIRALAGISAALTSTTAPIVGVSPIVAGAVVRGMADRLLPVVGAEVSGVGVAQWYGSRERGGLLDAWVLDAQDGESAPDLRRSGLRVAVVDTLMDDPEVAARLARTCLKVAGVPA